MSMDTSETAYPLRAWLEVFHPAYRGLLATMLFIGVVLGVLTFFGMTLINGFVDTIKLMLEGGALSCERAYDVFPLSGIFCDFGFSETWIVVSFILACYALVVLAQSLVQYAQIRIEALLEIRSRNDIEREILLNLLRKDDQFFQTHPATEITNRLGMDTTLMYERRKDLSELFTAFFEAAFVLYFLYRTDPYLALAALIISLFAIFVANRMLGDMKQLHAERMRTEDSVKGAFEDYLSAVPEVQMGGLEKKSARNLLGLQNMRQLSFMSMTMLNGRMSILFQANQLFALLAILGTVIFLIQFGEGIGEAGSAGLITAIVMYIPRFYGNVDTLVRIGVQYGLSKIAFNRLLEYETDPPKAGEVEVDQAAMSKTPLSIAGVTYAYSRGGPVKGGAEGIALGVAPNSLTALVGPAGSGKTTLTQLIMGRMQPTGGQIEVGGADLAKLGPKQRAAIFGYMPQQSMLLDGSIDDNVRFGIDEGHRLAGQPFDDEAVAWIDRSMVGEFAREKALNLPPLDAEAVGEGDLTSLRADLRRQVQAQTGIEVRPFSTAGLVPHLTVVENMTRSAAEAAHIIQETQGGPAGPLLSKLSDAPPSEPIIAFAMSVVEQTRQLLERCETFERYSELAPFPITPPVWGLRSDLIRMGPLDPSAPYMRDELMLVGLTAMPREAGPEDAEKLAGVVSGTEGSDYVEQIKRAFEPHLERLDERALNRYLSWRDNLLFGIAEVTNTRSSSDVDRVLLKAVADKPLDRALLVSGLSFRVGRQGKRLSGGQRKLVSLCRTLLQGNPVLILDEPTSDLDPNKRDAINTLLREAAASRTIIAITHDAELARRADNVVMMKDGQLWASGTFDALARENAEFRAVVNAEEEAGQ